MEVWRGGGGVEGRGVGLCGVWYYGTEGLKTGGEGCVGGVGVDVWFF